MVIPVGELNSTRDAVLTSHDGRITLALSSSSIEEIDAP